MVYAAMTHEYTFDYHDGECLLVHGRCRLGHRSQLHRLWPTGQRRDDLMFEGVPTYPDASAASGKSATSTRSTIFYTAPTAIRALMREGDEPVSDKPQVSRLLGTVGEPINPEAWNWYHESLAKGAAPSSTPGGRPKPAAT